MPCPTCNCCGFACCSAIGREFRSPMFDLAERRRRDDAPSNDGDDSAAVLSSSNDPSEEEAIMDVVRTFSPRPRAAYIFAKVFIAAWIVSIMASSITKATHSSFWMAYLTHWGLVVTAAYALMSVFVAAYFAMRPPENPGAPEGGKLLLVKITWALFAIALPGEIVITILFWVLEFDGTVRYVSVMVHGGALVLVAIDGFLLSRIPLRMKQFFLYESFSVIYILWSVIHAYSGIGNPYNDGVDKTDDAIYDSLAWKNNVANAAILSVGVVFVFNPIVFLFCRAVSRMFPRRLIEEVDKTFQGGQQQSSDATDEEAAAVVY